MKKLLSLSLLFIGLTCFTPQIASASNYKAFIVVGEASSDLIVSDGSSFYTLDYDWNCSSMDFTKDEVFYIDTYYTPSWGDDILVQDWLGEWTTCGVSSVDELNLKGFYVTDVIDSSDQIIAYDEYSNGYLIEYGIGCLGMWKYEDSTIYIDVGGSFLDGISDDIYLLDDEDTCKVWDVEELDSSSSGSYGGSSTYTYTDTIAPDYSSALLYAYTDSTKSEALSLSETNHDKTPYFEWSGVTDSSGIFSYVVYFGMDVNADPYSSDGEAVINTTYTPTNISKDGDYYLIVKAIDLYGNITSSFYWTYSYEEADDEDVCYDTTNGYLGTDGNCYCNAGYTWSDDVYACIENESSGGSADESIFSDVSSSNGNFDAISYLYENGIVSGYSDGSFKPSGALNRAELLKILVEGAGITPDETMYSNCFPDVTTDWYAKYVCYAKEQGWIEGYPDGTFRPATSVNKVEAIKMLLEVFGEEASEPSSSPFSDVPVSEWYAKYVVRAVELGLLEETGSYSPDSYITRGGVSENIYRLLIQL